MRMMRNPLAVAALALATLFVTGAGWPDSTAAATVTAKWGAQIRVGGVRPQGTATLYRYATGTGALGLRLTGLAPATNYWVALYTGTCSRLGTRVLLLPTVTSSSTGTVARGFTFRTALAARLRVLVRGKLSVAIGSVRRCGTLAPLSLTTTPTPTPIPTATPTFSATPLPPAPTPTPTPEPGPTPLPSPYDMD
jgi:hypothetical protein